MRPCKPYIDSVPLESVRIRNVKLTATGYLEARGEVNSRTELIGVLRSLPGGEDTLPEKWRVLAAAKGAKRPLEEVEDLD